MPIFLRAYSENPSAVAGAVLVFALVAASILAPLLTEFAPKELGGAPLQPPGAGHLMGTDDLGRDLWAQFLYGGRASVIVGLVAAAISTVIGVSLGAISGYFGGWVDDVVQRMTEMFSIVPRYFFAIVTVAILGASLINVICVIGLLSWPPMTKLVRAEFATLRSRSFVDAAKMGGEGPMFIIFNEILPNALPPIVVQTILTISAAVLMEATLSFLGLGDPNLISWGLMLNKAQQFLTLAPWMAIFPGLAISLFILGLNLMGDGFNQALNPRLRLEARK
ncbi:ABC transporter permease [Silicimonas algicola]|uniref:Peptide/nickel transport system permease protein n=1 Tax=Silicimonas algicola TaxID=1826607 RepID=A0A316GDI7_9RHOB|nr:ABC transporter permease [Silicimonas algicola]AZQ68309.1 ABC transporter permease [Silicimonas algicola]PWK52717.1 peptide/nickel transport system permease protein [Silicimonas algicola]